MRARIDGQVCGLTRYFDLYNARRRHSALDRRTPDTVYFDQVTCERAA